ncbi:MAG: hypothetical protein HYY26_07325 [Acidobacteria bacterium]|nr:hypothetical protein [Acidobacteriota bacterium]
MELAVACFRARFLASARLRGRFRAKRGTIHPLASDELRALIACLSAFNPAQRPALLALLEGP